MAIPGSEILALVTNQGKARITEMFATGKSFKIDTFRIGDGGYELDEPTLPLTPDPAATDVYGTPGGVLTKTISSVTYQTSTCPVFVCVVEKSEANGPVGSIGLFGTIVYSPISGDTEIGSRFLFALATRPFIVKTSLDSFTFNVGIIL